MPKPKVCPLCRGEGKILITEGNKKDGYVRKYITCTSCKGIGAVPR